MKTKLFKFLIFHSLILILLSCSSENKNVDVPIPATNKVENLNIISDLSKIYDEALHGIVAIRIDTIMGPAGSGSGFIWDDEGRIATNSHVVREAAAFLDSDVIVAFHDGYEFKANLIAHDIYSDLAILDVEYPDFYEFKPLPLGDSSIVNVGNQAIAIGNPFGENFTLTSGIISAIGRARPDLETNFLIGSVIQHDASINPGNSGGPLFNSNGEVIGINAQIASRSGSSSGIGFAIPINTAKRVIPSLVTNKYYEHSMLGISATEKLTYKRKNDLNIDDSILGIEVTYVDPEGPSGDSGLLSRNENNSGDIITTIEKDGEKFTVTSFSGLVNFLNENTSPGDIIELTVIRGNENLILDVKLGARPLIN
mgnify:FL=1